MSAMLRLSLLATLLAAGSSARETSSGGVTPIEKVITLLKDLQVKVEKQGTKEAMQYAKYTTFCKDQTESKKSAIDKSKEKIKVLEADIGDLASEIKSLNSDISKLGKEIAELEDDIKKATEERETQKKEYTAKAKDLSEAIDSCGEAVAALKMSKKDMTDAKVDLVQLKSAAFQVKVEQSPEAVKEALVSVRQAAHLAQSLSSRDHVEGAPAFEYQSNDILATIEDLEATFKSNKAELDQKEHDAQAAFDKKMLGDTNEKTFKSKEKKEKETLSESKTEEKSDDEQSKDEEDANMKGDESFLKELTSSCKQKSKDWDQRSKARADEMKALAEATATLEKGALANYNANKKLTSLVTSKESVLVVPELKLASSAATHVKGGKQAAVEKTVKPVSFLQIRSAASAQAAAVKRMLFHLDSSAGRLQSPILSAVAIQAQLKADHFSNVRKLIKDLMAKLKADAKAEESTKTFCDKEMKKAIENRDKANLQIEKANGIIATETSLAAEKKRAMEDFSEDIADLNKDEIEAEKLRKQEKADNTQTLEESKAGAKATGEAIKTLKGFYKSALIQDAYKPPKSDRYGETVGDVAPEAFEGEYKGAGESAKGILGILEVIKSDFERTVKTVEAEEKKAEEEYDKNKKSADDSITKKKGFKSDAGEAKKGAESKTSEAENDLRDAEKLLESAKAELDKLSSMCVDAEETWEERTAKRKEEIEALKEAFKILDDWQQD